MKEGLNACVKWDTTVFGHDETFFNPMTGAVLVHVLSRTLVYFIIHQLELCINTLGCKLRSYYKTAEFDLENDRQFLYFQ